MALIPTEVLALAYELRTEGVEWKYICKGLGYDPWVFASQLTRVQRHGIHGHRQVFTVAQQQRALDLRARGYEWRAIVAEFSEVSTEHEALRLRRACRTSLRAGRISNNQALVIQSKRMKTRRINERQRPE